MNKDEGVVSPSSPHFVVTITSNKRSRQSKRSKALTCFMSGWWAKAQAKYTGTMSTCTEKRQADSDAASPSAKNREVNAASIGRT